jgi:hypothetical protein
MVCSNEAYCTDSCLNEAYTRIQKLLCDIEYLPSEIHIYNKIAENTSVKDCDPYSFCKTSNKQNIKTVIKNIVKGYYTGSDQLYSSNYYSLFNHLNKKEFSYTCETITSLDECITPTAEEIANTSSNELGIYQVNNDDLDALILNLQVTSNIRGTIIGFDGSVIFDSLFFNKVTTNSNTTLIPAPSTVKNFRTIVPAIDQVYPMSSIVETQEHEQESCYPYSIQSYPRFNLNTRKEIQFGINNKKGYAYRYSPLGYWLKRFWIDTGNTDKWKNTDGSFEYFYAFGSQTFGTRCDPFSYTIRLGYQIPYTQLG